MSCGGGNYVVPGADPCNGGGGGGVGQVTVTAGYGVIVNTTNIGGITNYIINAYGTPATFSFPLNTQSGQFLNRLTGPIPLYAGGTSPQQDPAAVRQQQLDQTVDMATAKGTMSGLKNVLGPKVDTNALASAVTKISDGKPLTGPESTSMSALTPLISKAAETPQTAMALKTALSNAGMLSKQGK